ncbi:MAG: nuclear transport factor 2 family protein [Alphaproteobacteria bacterium]|nr:nuclear transport factor 2 family protein [Alphaproteobacteria bacterium]
MRTLLLALLLTSPAALAKKPAGPTVPAQAAVLAFYAGVDALQLASPHTDDVLGFTLDASGASLDVVGESGWQAVQTVLTQWGADGGTIATKLDGVTCWEGGTVAGCAAQVHQDFTLKGAPAGSADLRASFVLEWTGDVWAVAHFHEAPVATAPPAGTPEGGAPPREEAAPTE